MWGLELIFGAQDGGSDMGIGDLIWYWAWNEGFDMGGVGMGGPGMGPGVVRNVPKPHESDDQL